MTFFVCTGKPLDLLFVPHSIYYPVKSYPVTKEQALYVKLRPV